MGTVYIDRKGVEVRLDGDAIAFYVDGARDGTVPIGPIRRVVVCGEALIESAVLNRLAEEEISVLFLSGKRRQYRGVLHGRLHNNGLLRVRQYAMSLSPMAELLARRFVLSKLKAQADFLDEAFAMRQDRRTELTRGLLSIRPLTERLTSDEALDKDVLRGIEGGAAASYFKAYTALFPASLGFTERVRRPPKDPVNALLSLTYTMVHFETVREIEMAGLDPTIGFLHDFDYGRESLACDIIEPLRPMVDRWVWRLFADRVFSADHFTSGDELAGCYMKKNGRKEYYALYEEWVKAIRKKCVASVRELASIIMDGKHVQDALPE